jgi:Cd2+/Zn2+-exporting ATPase
LFASNAICENYVFSDWLYRALIFLISCPCALVISVRLFWIGAAKNGILFKGSNFLDLMASIEVVVMDKTGTLTKGVFKVQKSSCMDIPETDLIKYTATLETKSTILLELLLSN